MRREARVPAVVFDLDGTLIDSAPDIHRAANAALAAEGKPPLPLVQVRSFIGNGVAVLVERVMAASGLTGAEIHARMLARFMADYDAAPADLTRCFSGVAEALGKLRAQGARLAVCTNKPEATSHAILTALGLAPAFDVVIGGDSTPFRKPDPRPLLAAFDALGGRGLYVGDSEVDAATARAAGVPFLLFTEGYRAASVEDLAPLHTFSEFASLPEIVSEAAQRTGHDA